MTKTNIILDLIDVTAKQDSNLNVTDINEVSNVNDLQENKDIIDYATLEKNTFLLDGNEIILEQNDYNDTGYCSQELSNNEGIFENPIQLTINFTSYHTSAGITILFGDDSYCNNLNIKYYSDDDLILDRNYNPAEQNAYLAYNAIENYNKIIITFYSTNIPYRFLKIQSITYGFAKVFSHDDISSASSNHAINILSSELEINTLSFSIIDQRSEFNIVNPQGYYKDMQKNQKASVYEYIDDEEKFIGNFYLTSWSNSNVAQADFEAQDLIGVLDNYIFNGGIYTNKMSGKLINEILSIAGITEYIIEDNLTEIEITGYIPISTCREALQQVLFVIGGACNTTGEESLRIYKAQTNKVDNFIEDTRKVLDTTAVELNEKITAIEFGLYTYSLKSEISEISKGNLSGVNKIEFTNPINPETLIATNCIINDVDYNYAIITSEEDVQYKLEAYEYEQTRTSKIIQKVTKENLKENILTIDDVHLINMKNITDLATRIFNHYNATYKTTVEVLGENEKTGDYVSVNTFNDYKLLGNITSISYDLSGGFIGTIIIDNAILKQGSNEYYYCGNVYTGLEGIREVI